VTLCLTAADRTGEDGLVAQVGWAIRHGLDPDAALAAVTSTPARLLGLAGGALAEGRAADAVLWDGPPFEPTTRVLAVLIDGVVVSGALEAPKTPDATPNNPPAGPRRF
jgi:imidazolonepropionase-like amidohydrolase